jgi:poly(3-hydroxybutyrate) depolymerase
MVGNTNRDFQLVVPGNYDPNRNYPLVFGFHGQGWTMDGFRMASTSLVNAAAGGAIFVFPQGLPGGGGTGWDIGSANSRDITMVDALRGWVSSRLCVDQTRVFAFGRSYGGFFVNALACARGSTLRGAAVMMSGGPYFNCTASAPWWGTHNQDDGTVPFNNGTQSRDFWVRANGCNAQTQPVGPGPCVAYQGCRAAVHWCPNASGAHTPANYSNQAIWDFFESL